MGNIYDINLEISWDLPRYNIVMKVNARKWLNHNLHTIISQLYMVNILRSNIYICYVLRIPTTDTQGTLTVKYGTCIYQY